MSASENPDPSSLLYALLPVLPSAFFGLILVWQQGANLTSISFAFLMVLFSLVASYFIWVWHTDQLESLAKYHQQKYKEGLYRLSSYANELERLLLAAETKLAEQILAAKDIAEHDNSMLVRRLSAINENFRTALEATAGVEENKEAERLATLKIAMPGIAKDIAAILETRQFQDRIGPNLTLVKTNLEALKDKLVQIQKQGSERHKKMLNVDELMAQFQAQYEAVKRDSRNTAKRQAEETT